MYQHANSLPKIWLMTDERNDSLLENTIRKLPRHSGVIFRHYHLQEGARVERFAKLKMLARKHHHLILLADRPSLARKWGADGVHGRHWKRQETIGLLHSAPIHNEKEIRQAQHNGADIFFVSPVFTTRSHPESKPLNNLQLRRLNDLCGRPVVLLGGMDRQRFTCKRHLKAHGWAAIDALSQKNF
ncbi:MAG: thiamine phosphate synthase [Parasphingorhabdus sp.]